MLRIYLAATMPVSMTGDRKCRLRFPDLGLFKCFLPAWERLSLPLAVTLNRFRDALWVFILGMIASMSEDQIKVPIGNRQAIAEGKRDCRKFTPRGQGQIYFGANIVDMRLPSMPGAFSTFARSAVFSNT